MELSGDDFVRGCCNQTSLLARELTEFFVGERSGFFEYTKGYDERIRELIRSDVEVMKRPLGLSTPAV